MRLLRQPNRRMTWPAFARQIVADVLLRGNALAMIQTDGRGAVSALVPVPFGWLSPQVIDGAGRARLVFDCAVNTPAARLAGVPARMLADDCLHVRARSDDGVLGRSVLSRAGGVVHRALGADETASAMSDAGWHGQAYLTADGRIDADTVDRLRGQFQQAFGGGRSAGQMPILGNGLTIKSLSLNPEQLQLLATREFGVAEICRLFGIPEPLMQTGARVPADPTPWLALFAQTALAPIVCEI
ncbi:phage portal protein [Endobacter medicaginis]|uniref:Phage portal protein n=2 Tax=Endobacter medicaginis TaxID=1181271 RepID=A0A850NR12_9PROT|nr:phage portal protein [Endobacter medicaginis]MCX5477213.1 phage portal protein [Endobacter medicaginis]NVN30600.1 phage portal protein [Endobacter medicaginis]